MESISSSSSDSDNESDSIPRTSYHHVLKKSHVPGKYKENREAKSKASKGLINDSTSVCGSIVHKLNPTDPEFSSYEIIEKESEDEKSIPLERPKAIHISETEAKIVYSAKVDTSAGVGGIHGEQLKYISTETEHEKVDSSESSIDSFVILSHESYNAEECENTNKLADNSVAFDANVKHETMMCINEPKAGPFADDTTTDEGKGINVCIPVGSTSVTVPMAHSHPSSHSLLITVNIQPTPSTPTNTTENSNGDGLTESKLTDNITSLTSTSGGQPVREQTICGDIDAAAESNTHNDGGIDAADTPDVVSSKGRATDTTDYHDGEPIASDNESDKATGGDIDELYRRASSEIQVDIQKQRLTQSDSFVYDQKGKSNQYSRTRRTTDVTTSDDMQIDGDESFADVPLDLNEDVQPEIYHRAQPQLVLLDQPDTQSNDTGADERANQALMGRRKREIKKESERMIKSWDEVFIGTMVLLKYLGFWHAILVTGVSPISRRFRGIHYAWPGSGVFKIITRRTVQEDDFEANLADGDLWEVLIPESHTFSPEEAVERARAKIGEKKFNMFTRRSSHFVRECIMKR